jgi:hypothetical protein
MKEELGRGACASKKEERRNGRKRMNEEVRIKNYEPGQRKRL